MVVVVMVAMVYREVLILDRAALKGGHGHPSSTERAPLVCYL